jgi:hypothetical protein
MIPINPFYQKNMIKCVAYTMIRAMATDSIPLHIRHNVIKNVLPLMRNRRVNQKSRGLEGILGELEYRDAFSIPEYNLKIKNCS